MPPSVPDRIIEFCTAIVVTNHEQRLAFLRLVDKRQCAYLRDVAYNILLNKDLGLKDKDKIYLRRHKTSIKELASRKTCIDRRRVVLVRKHLLIKRLAQLTLEYLS